MASFNVPSRDRRGPGLRLLLGLLAGCVAFGALAHGDVTPHPVDTTGLKTLGTTWQDSNPYRGDAQAAAAGATGYAHNCAGCHGLNAESGGMAPDLLKLGDECRHITVAKRQAACQQEGDDYFREIVLHGRKNSEGRYVMPAYDGVFTQEAVWAVKTYIDARSAETHGGH